MKDKNLMVTISGGRSSAMSARYIQTSKKYKDYKKVYIFANTGQERKETIDFLKNIVKYWGIDLVIVEAVCSNVMGVGVSYKEVTFDTMSMNSEPFKDIIMHQNKGVFSGVPNQGAPYCSERLKTIPCKKYCDDIFGVNNYQKVIGYRKEDMPKRITLSEVKEDKTRIFPLLTDFETIIGIPELNNFWNEQDFKLSIHGKFGNCQLCWKKSDKNLIDNIRFGTDAIDFWVDMEKQYSNVAFRNNKGIDWFVKQAQLPFAPEIDFGLEDEYKCVCNF
jgi:3'-phosphoadenosine 5'-phosphosulfate sulfotransferase (PAPS reductase)/FAD synthetase